MENLRKSKYLKWIVGALGLVAIVAVSIGGYQWYIERGKANITQNYNIDTVVPQLQEISGDMTYQIRNFALTGDVEFLRTYWDCVFIEGGRDVVLKPLEQLVIQGEESKELEELKYQYALLEAMEVCTFRQIFAEQGITYEQYENDHIVKNYIRYVNEYRLPVVENFVYPEQALNYLISNEYADRVEMISEETAEFVAHVRMRLEADERAESAAIDRIYLVQLMGVLATLLCVCVFLLLNNRVYSLRKFNKDVLSTLTDEFLMISVILIILYYQ